MPYRLATRVCWQGVPPLFKPCHDAPLTRRHRPSVRPQTIFLGQGFAPCMMRFLIATPSNTRISTHKTLASTYSATEDLSKVSHPTTTLLYVLLSMSIHPSASGRDLHPAWRTCLILVGIRSKPCSPSTLRVYLFRHRENIIIPYRNKE